MSKWVLTDASNHVRKDGLWIFNKSVLALAQLALKGRPQSVHDQGRKERQVRRDQVPYDFMHDSTVRMFVALDDTRRKGTKPCDIINRVHETEALVHEHLPYDGTRDDGESLVQDRAVEDWSIPLLASGQEPIGVFSVFGVMSGITAADSGTRYGLAKGKIKRSALFNFP